MSIDNQDSKKFALVLVTTNRLHLVERFFLSLKTQEYKNFSVTFAHNAGCEREAALLTEKYISFFPISRINLEPCGVSKARNQALAVTSGDFLAFPDDDCEYFPDTLAKVAEYFYYNHEIGAILAGKATSKKLFFNFQDRVNKYNAFVGSETWLQFYRWDAATKLDGFDENLGNSAEHPYGSGEDTDYILSALEHGITIKRRYEIKINHPQENLFANTKSTKIARYAAGRMRLLNKYCFPAWFKWVNVFYPIAALPCDIFYAVKNVVERRWKMFLYRKKYI